MPLCDCCEEPATRRCSGCKVPEAWYCSEECQRRLWRIHIFDCNPKKPINTAYHLARAVMYDCFPDDPQTREDYGFERAFMPEKQSKLLGLYIGLIGRMEVEPKEIHRWRSKGTLVEEIKMAFEKLPENNRGGYYPWFLENQWVIDRRLRPPTDAVQEVKLRGWLYAGGSSSATPEEIDATQATWPKTKQQCLIFCTLLLSSWHPSPSDTLWLTFGFCACMDEHSENELGNLYHRLIANCSFDEIHTAYESSALIQLFDAKGLWAERQHFQDKHLVLRGGRTQHLEDILAGTPNWNKSVWNLKQFVFAENGDLIPSIRMDYGFFNCKGEAEKQELKGVYKRFFVLRDGDPIELHEAAINGRLFEHVGRSVKLKKKFRRLMKNPYPLPDLDI